MQRFLSAGESISKDQLTALQDIALQHTPVSVREVLTRLGGSVASYIGAVVIPAGGAEKVLEHGKTLAAIEEREDTDMYIPASVLEIYYSCRMRISEFLHFFSI